MQNLSFCQDLLYFLCWGLQYKFGLGAVNLAGARPAWYNNETMKWGKEYEAEMDPHAAGRLVL